MRRFLTLVALLTFTASFGIAVSGCSKATAVQYCNAGDSGPVVGQVASILLSPSLFNTGESLSYGQIGQGLSASAIDCKGNSVSVPRYTYATTDMSFADINPTTGSVCAGTWNRNSGGGVPDYTTCFPPAATTPGCISTQSSNCPVTAQLPGTAIAYVTATGGGAVSNAIAVYVHAAVTGVKLVGTASTNCTTDPGTDCACSNNGGISVPVYDLASCVSQGKAAQLVAKVYTNGTTNPADNITCKVGHLNFSATTSSNILTIDQNGIATANQPGSTLITASVANSSTGSGSGYFATCPPASITLSAVGQTGTNINVPLNNTQSLVATVLDTNGNPVTGLNLLYTSTTPQTVAGGSSLTPTFPGAATITAVCEPGGCNPSPFSQIGYLGNGAPITSNGLNVTTTGTSSTVLFMGSLSSQYMMSLDFTTNLPSTLIKLPYVPNSMVISQDATTLYLGSAGGLMTVSTLTNTPSSANANVPGIVLAISPDGSTLVVTDPVRKTVSLVSSTGSVAAVNGGVATRAVFSPDGQTVYITTDAASGGILLTHSSFTSWQTTQPTEVYKDAVVTVPAIGAYFAGATTEGRSYCPNGTITGAGTPPSITNGFAPLSDSKAVPTDRLAATNDGQHILGATATTSPAQLTDLHFSYPTQTVSGVTSPKACPTTPITNGVTTIAPTFTTTVNNLPLTGTTVSAINGIVPASNSALAFITYTGAGGVLPLYVPAAAGAGSLTNVPLTGGATLAPVAGVFSTDNKTFYVGTSGDNLVHKITITGTTATDSGTINPQLPDANGVPQTPNLIAQRPKRTTS